MRRLAVLVLFVGVACTGSSGASSSTASPAPASPSPSPVAVDGDRLLVVRDDGNLETLDPNGGEVLALTTDAGPDVVVDQPVASPDGRSIAWVELRCGRPAGRHDLAGRRQPAGDPAHGGAVLPGVGPDLDAHRLSGERRRRHRARRDRRRGRAASRRPGRGRRAAVPGLVARRQPSCWCTSARTDSGGPTSPIHFARPATPRARSRRPRGSPTGASSTWRARAQPRPGGDRSRRSDRPAPVPRRRAVRAEPRRRPRGLSPGRPRRHGNGRLRAGPRRRARDTRDARGHARLLLVTGRRPAAAPDRRPERRAVPMARLAGTRTVRRRPFVPSPTFLRDYLPFFDQYAQTITPWAPDGSAFAYAGLHEGESGIWVQPLAGRRRLIGDGAFVTWTPTPDG